jgi:hypothetical protein
VGAGAEQLGVVRVDGETDLDRGLSNDVGRRRRDSIDEITATDAQGVIVSIDSTVESAGMVAERQLQDDAVIGEGVERVVDCAEGDTRQHGPHALEDIGGARMVVAGPHGIEDRLTLGRHPKPRFAGTLVRFDVI